MKNLFLSVVLLLTVTFAFAANDVEKITTVDVEQTVELTNSVELTKVEFTVDVNYLLETVGLCCITIWDSNGNVVYQECLPANTPEACESMLSAILSALNKK